MADQPHKIIDDTRRSIIDALLAIGNPSGDKEYHDFLRWVFPAISESVINDVWRHMDHFDDYPETYLFDNAIDYLSMTDEDFGYLLAQYVNPTLRHTRWDDQTGHRHLIHNSELVETVNKYLSHDGYQLSLKDTIGDKDFYHCIPIGPGVKGAIKNIIFAAKYKPEICFDDALNNDIRITKNADQCLVYDRPIPTNGVSWNELVNWYAEENDISENQENRFISRLCQSLDTSYKKQGTKSGPETWLLQAYYELKNEYGIDPPALIPQVYLYYDPQTLAQRGYKLFEHQKMDFLMIFSQRERVVIEIDGKQHYADGEKASPQLYAEMTAAHREMSLFGYDVYRFGGYEFYGAAENQERKRELLDKLKKFFIRLFSKYGIEVDA